MSTPPAGPEQAWRAFEEWGWVVARTWQEAQATFARDSFDRVIALSQSARGATPALDADALTSAGRNYAEFVSRAVSLSLAYAEDLTALAQSAANRLLQDVQGATAGPSAPPAIHLVLHGVVGTTVATKVTLANHQPHRHDVTFEAGPITGPAGSFPSSLRVEPPVLTLDPGAEAEVELCLDLPAEHFEPGRVYVGQVMVCGGDEVALALTIRVDAPT